MCNLIKSRSDYFDMPPVDFVEMQDENDYGAILENSQRLEKTLETLWPQGPQEAAPASQVITYPSLYPACRLTI